MLLFPKFVVCFLAGWGLMDILVKHTNFPDWMRFLILFSFSISFAITL
jgi:hypothetical protein